MSESRPDTPPTTGADRAAPVVARAALKAVGRLGVLAALIGTAAGCRVSRAPMHPQHEQGQWYQIEEGDSLAELARRSGVPAEDLLEVNGLRSPDEVRPGVLLFVLDGPAGRVALSSRPVEEAGAGPGSASASASASAKKKAGPEPGAGPADPDGKEPALGPRLRWPVDQPRITSFFGTRWGRRHEGIDLTAAVGTPVYAAALGEVVYAGNKLRGYGNMVVVRHAGDLMTVYAHNSVVLVHVGERVKLGQRVALSGQSGHASGPHVHFEVRKGQIPRDPLPFLPNLRGLSPKS